MHQLDECELVADCEASHAPIGDIPPREDLDAAPTLGCLAADARSWRARPSSGHCERTATGAGPSRA